MHTLPLFVGVVGAGPTGDAATRLTSIVERRGRRIECMVAIQLLLLKI